MKKFDDVFTLELQIEGNQGPDAKRTTSYDIMKGDELFGSLYVNLFTGAKNQFEIGFSADKSVRNSVDKFYQPKGEKLGHGYFESDYLDGVKAEFMRLKFKKIDYLNTAVKSVR